MSVALSGALSVLMAIASRAGRTTIAADAH